MSKRLSILGCVVLMLSAVGSAQAAPNRVVLGYSASWFDSKCSAEYFNFDSLTYLARAFLAPHPDGSIDVPGNYFDKKMESMARQHGVKMLMSIGGEADNADNWLSISRHAEYQERFFGELEKLMGDHGYDGIDIDWEPSAVNDADGAAYTSLLKSLRGRFPKAIITTALCASEYWISHFSWRDVCDNVDYVNVMVYDYSGGWGGKAAYASNLFPPGAYPPQPEFSVDQGMKNLIENHKVPAGKLLMGMTFWASRFGVDHIGNSFPVNGKDYSMNITYAQTISLLRGGEYREFWDEKAAMPYLERNSGGSVVCYENPQSIRQKCDYAAKLGCAGVMIWHVGADIEGGRAPLMDALAESCGGKGQIFGRAANEIQIADLKEQIAQAAPATVDGGSGELSKLNDGQLEDLRLQLQKEWAAAEQKLWDGQAAQRGKQMN